MLLENKIGRDLFGRKDIFSQENDKLLLYTRKADLNKDVSRQNVNQLIGCQTQLCQPPLDTKSSDTCQ